MCIGDTYIHQSKLQNHLVYLLCREKFGMHSGKRNNLFYREMHKTF